MNPAATVHIRQGETGTVAIDARYCPLIVACFIGDVNLQLGMWFEQTAREIVLGEAVSGRRVISIHDATHSTRTSPEMRKFWADLSTRNEEAIGAQTLHNFIVVGNPITRGVVTAVSWLNPRVSRIEVFANLPRAVAEAATRLEAIGTPVALPKHGYCYSDDVNELLRAAKRR